MNEQDLAQLLQYLANEKHTKEEVLELAYRIGLNEGVKMSTKLRMHDLGGYNK